MKKKIKKICCVFLIMVLCTSTLMPTYAKSSNYNTIVKKYRNYIKRVNGTGKHYRIVDIDGNGVPELILHTWNDNRICTYDLKKKKIVCLGMLSCGKGYYLPIVYSKKTHCVMISSANTGSNIKEIYRINGTSSKMVVKAESFNGKFDSGYEINGRKVKKNIYNRKIGKYMKKTVTINIPR